MDIGIATARRPDGSVTRARVPRDGGRRDRRGDDREHASRAQTPFGWLAYVDAAFRAFPRSTKVHIHYRLDHGHERSAHVSTILVANCGTLPGNMELIPDGAIDDG